MTHKKTAQMADVLNDLANALTAMKWPDEIKTDHGTTIPSTVSIYQNLYCFEKVFYEMESDLHDCVNELCLQCGKYHHAYDGSCDGCRWLEVKEGFR